MNDFPITFIHCECYHMRTSVREGVRHEVVGLFWICYDCGQQKFTMKTITWTFWFLSSEGDKEYETLLYDDKTTSCNCPGWTRRTDEKGRRSCKHTRLVEAGATDQAVRSLEAGHSVEIPATKSKTTQIAPGLGQRKIIME